MRLGNMIFIFTLIFLITLSGCQRVAKQTIDQNNKITEKQTADQNNQSNISLSAKNTTVEEKEEDIYIAGDAKKYLERKESINPGLLLNKDLEPIYEKYKETLNDDLLKGLQPIDILRLHNRAVEEENLEVETNLIILPPEIKRENFLKEVQNDGVSKKNGKLLLEKYKQFNGKVIEITVNEKNAYVIIQGDGSWRFEKTEDGVWKLRWLARQ